MSTNISNAPPVARYYVIIERDVIEGDYSRPYGDDGSGNSTGTDGTYESAVAQLAAELQEGWDAAGIGGFFGVVGREIVESYDYRIESVMVPEGDEWPREDNPEPYLWPAPPVKPAGLTPLPITYWGKLKRPECTGSPDERGDNFHNGDTCPICEDEDSPWYEGGA
jgi:hypothetical protein